MIVKIWQIFLIFVFKAFVFLFFDFKVEGVENIKNRKGPLLIVSNHKSVLDFIFVGLALSYNLKLWPLRFMADYNKFKTKALNLLSRLGVIKVLFFLSGCFPAKKDKNIKKSLAVPLCILKDGGVVVIFAEGERVFKEGVGEIKRGAAALAIFSGVSIFPVVIKNNFNLKFKDIFLRRKIRVVIGEDFGLSNMEDENDFRFLKERGVIKNNLEKL